MGGEWTGKTCVFLSVCLFLVPLLTMVVSSVYVFMTDLILTTTQTAPLAYTLSIYIHASNQLIITYYLPNLQDISFNRFTKLKPNVNYRVRVSSMPQLSHKRAFQMIGELVAVGSLLPFIFIIIHPSSLNLCVHHWQRDLHMKPSKLNCTQKEFGEAISPYLAIY